MIEYITKFDECAIRCCLDEPSSVTLYRFRAGLREDIQRELYLRRVTDLDQAYQVVENYERFQ